MQVTYTVDRTAAKQVIIRLAYYRIPFHFSAPDKDTNILTFANAHDAERAHPIIARGETWAKTKE